MSESKVEYNVENIDISEIDITDSSILIDLFGEEFARGVGSVAEVAGMIHALELVGIEPAEALDYILQMKAAEHEKMVLDDNNKVQIEIAKIQGAQSEKNSV